jgi:hypothetical protein
MVFLAAGGCGGGGGGVKDAGPDVSADVAGDAPGQEVGMEAPAADHVSTDGGSDADAAQPDAADAGPDAADGGLDATDGNDGPSDDRPADAAPDAPPVMDAASEEGPPPPPVMLTVDALLNTIVLDRCTNLTPATLVDVAAGQHTIALTASNLSKGSVSDPNDDPVPSFDDYVIVHLRSPPAIRPAGASSC